VDRRGWDALVAAVTTVAVVGGAFTAYKSMPKRSQAATPPAAVSPSVTGNASLPPSCGAGFTALDAASVRDGATCLVWRRTAAPDTYTFAGAKAYCADLGGGWRVPTRKELAGLVDVSAAAPTIPRKAFPDTPEAAFWTSTKVSAAQAWAIDFTT
jgi:Protein of unknown function (DUF1566)